MSTQFEPGAGGYGDQVACSQAISLKRIADSLETIAWALQTSQGKPIGEVLDDVKHVLWK